MQLKIELLKDAICNNNISFLEENKHRYDINERLMDEDNDTLLMYAISDAKTDVFEYFLRNGADYMLVNDEGENILHGIVFSGDVKRLRAVAKRLNADLNHQALDGATPLLLAVSLGRYKLAKVLIELGADVGMGDINEITPLHLACQDGNVEFVNLLINCNLFELTTDAVFTFGILKKAGVSFIGCDAGV